MSDVEEDQSQENQPGEVLTVSYERLRHSTNAEVLSQLARRDLPDRADNAAFSRATALLEAIAGNEHTPVEDRVYLAESMPFPNILVKLSKDPDPVVRRAVAANTNDKNWLAGLLTKDPDQGVRAAALTNPMTSWKMRLEGAENADTDAQTLDHLGKLGVEIEPKAPVVLAAMVRRAVALNPSTSPETIERLKSDQERHVATAAASR
ncbi:AbrB family transcriptional regulator [Bombiscardovia coagulans]|uniref:AbrB family transcriptional regulator n=1 Tax=Bombiscardovia coagulans TaxID=686666 RepID=A0A261EU19_9BIFI|nr:AbrB family transcriptional regulator [Bombiscardovia coagulans]OZG50337.1 AbrB family transcriptional regulator [Bombiscardovia coagulans]